MVRKSNSKRKSVAQGFQKRGPIISKAQNYGSSWLTSSIINPLLIKKFTKTTESVFNSYLRLAIALRFLPLEQIGEGHYVVPKGLRIIPFVSYKILILLIVVHRLTISVTLYLTEDVTAPVLLAIVYSVSLSLPWFLSVWNPVDTAFIWSNLESLLHDLPQREGRKVNRFDSLLLCVKVLCILGLIPTIPVCAVGNGLLFGGLPTSWFRSLESLGWIDAESGGAVWWLLACLPLEAVTVFFSLLTPAFVCIMALTTLEAIKTYGKEIRRISIINLNSRHQVERMFIRWQVFAKVTNDWVKLITVPVIVGIAGASTMFLFVTIRFTNIPFFVYIFFPIIAFTFLLLLAITLYEAVSVTQISQQVLSGKLLSFDHCELLRLLGRNDRKKLTLRAKALKPIAFPIGSFTEIKYAVMADIWEEILNQLLFLLSF